MTEKVGPPPARPSGLCRTLPADPPERLASTSSAVPTANGGFPLLQPWAGLVWAVSGEATWAGGREEGQCSSTVTTTSAPGNVQRVCVRVCVCGTPSYFFYSTAFQNDSEGDGPAPPPHRAPGPRHARLGASAPLEIASASPRSWGGWERGHVLPSLPRRPQSAKSCCFSPPGLPHSPTPTPRSKKEQTKMHSTVFGQEGGGRLEGMSAGRPGAWSGAAGAPLGTRQSNGGTRAWPTPGAGGGEGESTAPPPPASGPAPTSPFKVPSAAREGCLRAPVLDQARPRARGAHATQPRVPVARHLARLWGGASGLPGQVVEVRQAPQQAGRQAVRAAQAPPKALAHTDAHRHTHTGTHARARTSTHAHPHTETGKHKRDSGAGGQD